MSKLNPKLRLLSGVAVVAVSAATCAAAVAASPYTVKLNLPKAPGLHHTFKIKASGVSKTSSRLTLFVSSKSCASSAKSEARSGQALLNKTVSRSYSATKSVRAGSLGTRHACAYLTTGSTTRAHAAATYTVVFGGY